MGASTSEGDGPERVRPSPGGPGQRTLGLEDGEGIILMIRPSTGTNGEVEEVRIDSSREEEEDQVEGNSVGLPKF